MRIARKLEILAGHAQRDLSWFFGGKSFYSRHSRRILARQRWVFLVGCNNSGTTLLHDLLDSSGYFSCMKHEGQRYTRVIGMAERRRHERVWTEYMHDLRLTEEDEASSVSRLLHDWLAVTSDPHKSFFLEKTTANSVRTRWLQKSFPNSYFIGIVRNGYAVSESICRKGAKSADRAARHWREVNTILEKDSQHLKNFLQLRYENLADDPELSLRKISKFLGFFENALIDAVDLTHVRNMNSISLANLTAQQRKCIQREARDLLMRYGYEPLANVEHT